MECYGKIFNKKSECSKCNLKKWCKEASDPPKLSQQMKNWDDLSELTNPFTNEQEYDPYIKNRKFDEIKKIYTQNDLLEVIGFLVALDTQTLEILDSKLGNSGITFSEIGRRRGVTRQAVHKFIKKKCAQIPELSTILQNHSQKRKTNKNFMEAVCQIKKKTSDKKLKKLKADSKFSKKLICLNRNLDLSKMNILKGSIIIKNALKA
jgi:predicted DNA-binding protein YlxM (UPF0122 family)